MNTWAAAEPHISDHELRQLEKAARKVAKNAYSPYSGFSVGAAVLTESGNFYTGCNVENASYSMTMCAERSAIFAAVASEGRAIRIRALVVVNEQQVSFSPCGACRQVLSEFSTDASVTYQSDSGLRRTSSNELLPDSFRIPWTNSPHHS